jgi:hypothetical protein
MALKIETHDVAFVKDGNVVEHEIQVWGVDKLRGELEARWLGAKGVGVDVKGRDNVDIKDLGDHLTREALNLWSACVRLGLYEGDSRKWRLEDYVASEKHETPKDEPDPTPSAQSTGPA